MAFLVPGAPTMRSFLRRVICRLNLVAMILISDSSSFYVFLSVVLWSFKVSSLSGNRALVVIPVDFAAICAFFFILGSPWWSKCAKRCKR